MRGALLRAVIEHIVLITAFLFLYGEESSFVNLVGIHLSLN